MEFHKGKVIFTVYLEKDYCANAVLSMQFLIDKEGEVAKRYAPLDDPDVSDISSQHLVFLSYKAVIPAIEMIKPHVVNSEYDFLLQVVGKDVPAYL